MGLLDRTVIARTKGAVPRQAAIEADLLRPAGLLPPAQVAGFAVTSWRHDGAHLLWILARGGETAHAIAGPRRDDDGAYLRTAAWNVGYREGAYSAELGAALGLIGQGLQGASDALGLDAAGATLRWFTRPAVDDVLEISPGKKLYVRVTDHCDEKCLFCNATEGNANIVPSKTALRSLVARIPTGQLTQVIFSGGEPTLVKALPEMVGLAYGAGARQIIVQTNGVGLARPGALEAYLPYRDRLGIGFSLHATDAALSAQMLDHPDLLRHDAKLRAIDRAVELGFLVKLTCVVMRPNLGQVPAFARWAWARWGKGLARLQFSYAMPRGNAWLNRHLVLRFGECVAPFAEAFELGRATGLRIETSQSACVPPCVMPDYVDHQDLYGDFAGRTADPERVKPEAVCGGCNWDRICAGVWRRYIDVFGTDELRAVTDRPEPAVDLDDFVQPEVLDLTDC
ncbi:MAG: radical SAM protein [Deltaproteobacteria bacterium]|nr:radical SAM protein [Deltaproteobacteria bacterium]